MLAHEVETQARPLSREDLSILALENETVAGHTCKVIVLGGPVGLGALRASIAARLARAPRLSMRLGEIDGAPWWVPDPQVDVAAHVVEATSAPGRWTRPGSGPRWRASSPSTWTAPGRCGGST